MNVGDRLRRLRQHMGLSQRDLARRAGVTNATISMIERNKISPSVGSAAPDRALEDYLENDFQL